MNIKRLLQIVSGEVEAKLTDKMEAKELLGLIGRGNVVIRNKEVLVVNGHTKRKGGEIGEEEENND